MHGSRREKRAWEVGAHRRGALKPYFSYGEVDTEEHRSIRRYFKPVAEKEQGRHRCTAGGR